MSTDLSLENRALGAQASDSATIDMGAERGDLKLASGRDNVAQAVVNRLLTRQGELTDLGHPGYGSRLYQLVGEPNSRRARTLADLYIRESLAAEPRIREITSIVFPPASRSDKREVLETQIVLRLVDDNQPLIVSTAVKLTN